MKRAYDMHLTTVPPLAQELSQTISKQYCFSLRLTIIIMNSAKNVETNMVEKTGVESSVDEEEVRRYFNEVLDEIKRRRKVMQLMCLLK